MWNLNFSFNLFKARSELSMFSFENVVSLQTVFVHIVRFRKGVMAAIILW